MEDHQRQVVRRCRIPPEVLHGAQQRRCSCTRRANSRSERCCATPLLAVGGGARAGDCLAACAAPWGGDSRAGRRYGASAHIAVPSAIPDTDVQERVVFGSERVYNMTMRTPPSVRFKAVLRFFGGAPFSGGHPGLVGSATLSPVPWCRGLQAADRRFARALLGPAVLNCTTSTATASCCRARVCLEGPSRVSQSDR
jgi:hypothetical protein